MMAPAPGKRVLSVGSTFNAGAGSTTLGDAGLPFAFRNELPGDCCRLLSIKATVACTLVTVSQNRRVLASLTTMGPGSDLDLSAIVHPPDLAHPISVSYTAAADGGISFHFEAEDCNPCSA